MAFQPTRITTCNSIRYTSTSYSRTFPTIDCLSCASYAFPQTISVSTVWHYRTHLPRVLELVDVRDERTKLGHADGAAHLLKLSPIADHDPAEDHPGET